ncbi:MAG: PIN domain-containing protein [Chloroflexi bacterium]|nr:PIN domain-containing protein [Chloroflexota bacterium]
MTFIADSNFVYALYNANDIHHQDGMSFLSQNTEVMLVPDVVLPEVSYLITRDIGHSGMQTFLEHYMQLDVQLEAVGMEDLARVRDIVSAYADARFDIVDCCIMAIAERLNVTRIATFDRRDFSIFQPRHCDFLELLP